MAASVSAVLELDASEALAAVNEIEQSLAAATDTFGVGLSAAIDAVTGSTVEVEADASSITGSVDEALAATDAQLELFPEVDLSNAESEIASLSGEDVEIGVGANTAPAEQAIDGLAESAQEGKGSASGLTDELGNLSAGALGASGNLGRMSASLTNLAGSSGPAAAGVAAVVGGLALSIGAAGEAQEVNARLDQILQNQGDHAAVTGDHIRDLATDIMQYSGFSDEAVVSGAGLLATFQNINNNPLTFDRTLRDSADLARFMGTDFPSAAKMLGRALNDPERGVSRLARTFPALTGAEQDAIKAMAASGDVAGAQAAIFDLVERSVGGLADAYGQTLPGQIDRAQESMGELAETLGGKLLPEVNDSLEGIIALTDALNNLPQDLGDILPEFDFPEPPSWVTDGFTALAESAPFIGPILQGGELSDILGTIGDQAIYGEKAVTSFGHESAPAIEETADAAKEAADEISDLTAEIDTYLGSLFDVPAAQRDLRDSFTSLHEEMVSWRPDWDAQAEAMEGVVEQTGRVIQAQLSQDATQAELDATIAGSILVLAEMRNSGELTAEQFRELTADIEGVPHQAATTVSAPGLSTTHEHVNSYRQDLDRLDGRSVRTSVSVGIERAAFDALVRDLDAADVKRFTAQVSVNRTDEASLAPTGGNTITISPGAFPITISGDVSDERAARVGSIVVASLDEALADAHARVDTIIR